MRMWTMLTRMLYRELRLGTAGKACSALDRACGVAAVDVGPSQSTAPDAGPSLSVAARAVVALRVQWVTGPGSTLDLRRAVRTATRWQPVRDSQPPQMIGQSRCKCDDRQCWGCVPGGREDRATSEEQIADPMDPAIRVDHAVSW